MRFAIVGGISGGIYAAVVALLVHFELASPTIASMMGYIAAIPLNFVGQRSYTFRSKGNVSSEFVRFVVIQMINISVSALVMWFTVSVLGLTYIIGILLTIALIPVSSYVCLKFLVFLNS